MSPPWQSKYTVNINTEMNYWPAEPTNLSECVEPLIRMVTELAESGRRTARVQYGADGWICHHNTDLWRATAPIDGPQWGFFQEAEPASVVFALGSAVKLYPNGRIVGQAAPSFPRSARERSPGRSASRPAR